MVNSSPNKSGKQLSLISAGGNNEELFVTVACRRFPSTVTLEQGPLLGRRDIVTPADKKRSGGMEGDAVALVPAESTQTTTPGKHTIRG